MEQETRIFEAINNLQNTKIALEQNKFMRQKEITSLNQQMEEIEVNFSRMKSLYADSLIADQQFEDAERTHRYGKKTAQNSVGTSAPGFYFGHKALWADRHFHGTLIQQPGYVAP